MDSEQNKERSVDAGNHNERSPWNLSTRTLTQKTYLYQLAQREELSWFRNIYLLGSQEDEYVPYTSAVLRDHDFLFKTENAKAYRGMLEGINKSIEKADVCRGELVFNYKIKDLSSFIGRTAHIKILSHINTFEHLYFLIRASIWLKIFIINVERLLNAAHFDVNSWQLH